MVGAFEGNEGGVTLSHVEKLFHEPYLTGYKRSEDKRKTFRSSRRGP